MKKVFVVFALGIILLGSCNVTIERKIVGTWVDREDNKWIFSADGSLKYENNGPNDTREYHYDVTETKLTFEIENNIQTYDISMSSDGKTFILTNGKKFSYWNTAGPGWDENRLIRYSTPPRNAFTGTWSGDVYGDKFLLTIEGTRWTISDPEEPGDFERITSSAVYNGNSATINENGVTIAATVSRDTLTMYVEGEAFTFTKQ